MTEKGFTIPVYNLEEISSVLANFQIKITVNELKKPSVIN